MSIWEKHSGKGMGTSCLLLRSPHPTKRRCKANPKSRHKRLQLREDHRDLGGDRETTRGLPSRPQSISPAQAHLQPGDHRGAIPLSKGHSFSASIFKQLVSWGRTTGSLVFSLSTRLTPGDHSRLGQELAFVLPQLPTLDFFCSMPEAI